jgi:ABC-type amino acid transport substrate-binding protein
MLSSRVPRLTALAAALAAATLFAVAAPAPPAAAVSTACPWVGSSAPIAQRVSELLARLTVAQKARRPEPVQRNRCPELAAGAGRGAGQPAVRQVPGRHQPVHHAGHAGADLVLLGRG